MAPLVFLNNKKIEKKMAPESILQQISTTLGISWASGINLYATLLVMGVMHSSGTVVLPEGIDYVAHPLVMIAAGVMFLVEFFVDKIPGIDKIWDSFHTFIRIPARVAMAYGAAVRNGASHGNDLCRFWRNSSDNFPCY